jgi:hypothetical protein
VQEKINAPIPQNPRGIGHPKVQNKTLAALSERYYFFSLRASHAMFITADNQTPSDEHLL